MQLIPEFSFELNNTWQFTLPYFILSIGFLFLIPKHNISKFVQVPKIKLITEINYILYYGFLFASIFIPLQTELIIFYIGIVLFVIGIIFYSASIFYFSISEYNKPVTEKVYKISRHPVYLSFFIIGIAISMAGASLFLLIIVILHFISTIFIIKEEEKNCIASYGEEYKNYMKKVRMII